jgi:hypothetical protein
MANSLDAFAFGAPVRYEHIYVRVVAPEGIVKRTVCRVCGMIRDEGRVGPNGQKGVRWTCRSGRTSFAYWGPGALPCIGPGTIGAQSNPEPSDASATSGDVS